MRFLLTLLLALMLLPTLALAANLQPGEYRSAYGSLLIKRERGELRFAIDATGPNAHTCAVDGVIGRDGVGKASDEGPPRSCRVEFLPITRGYRVNATTAACRDFCGARANFDGDYIIPPKGCSRTEIAATRKQFLANYQRRQYAPAAQLLEPLLDRCLQLLDRFEDGWIRNDLAIAQFHLGDPQGCRDTLAPLAELAQDADPGGAEPSLQAELRRLAKATRTNLTLCGGH